MTNESGPNCIEAQICRADFYAKLIDALDQCGGRSDPNTIERYQEMKLKDIVNILAQNGIRMVYEPQYHMNNNL